VRAGLSRRGEHPGVTVGIAERNDGLACWRLLLTVRPGSFEVRCCLGGDLRVDVDGGGVPAWPGEGGEQRGVPPGPGPASKARWPSLTSSWASMAPTRDGTEALDSDLPPGPHS
jgi:hypothetical protein